MTQHNWDLEKIFANDAERKDAKAKLDEKLKELAALAPGKIEDLNKIMITYSDFTGDLSRYASYAFMRKDVVNNSGHTASNLGILVYVISDITLIAQNAM